MPKVRQACRRAKPTPWTPSSIAPGTSSASPHPAPRRRSTPRPPTIGCPSINTSAASNTRFCTCSIRASSPAPWAPPATCRRTYPEPFDALFTQGMVVHETYKSAAAPGCCQPKSASRRRRQPPRHRDRDRQTRRHRLHRKDVQVEEKLGRSRRHHRRITVPTAPAGSFCPTARPSATSSGPRAASQAPASSSSASGALSKRSLMAKGPKPEKKYPQIFLPTPSPCANPPTRRCTPLATISRACASMSPSPGSTN